MYGDVVLQGSVECELAWGSNSIVITLISEVGGRITISFIVSRAWGGISPYPTPTLPSHKESTMSERKLRELLKKHPALCVVWHRRGWTFWNDKCHHVEVGMFKTLHNDLMWNLCVKIGIPIKNNT